MSIVGTRPPLISETNLYEPRHKARLRIYMNAPRNGMFDSEIQNSEQLLKINCKLVMQDPCIRKKMKIALLMYMFARPIMPIVYKKINRWK